MSDDLSILDYLAQGGKLTSPENVSARYRAELMRQMASFIDSELAGAAGFADWINAGPGIKERIAASRIVLEKHDHAERILKIMGEFGANTDRYQTVHPWHERIGREDGLESARQRADMRLNVFYYPITGWTDAVVMNVLMGMATVLQIGEFTRSSYQPFAEAMQSILLREQRHLELGREGVEKLSREEGQRVKIRASYDYWRTRVSTSFGDENPSRIDALKKLGLRSRANADLRTEWTGDVDQYFRQIFKTTN